MDINQDIINWEKPNEATKSHALREFYFSRGVRAGGLVVSCILVLIAALAVTRTQSFSQRLTVAAIVCSSVVASLMLWLRNAYAVHAWAALAAVIGLATVASCDFRNRDGFYWAEALGILLMFCSISLGLFSQARQMAKP